MTTTCNSEESDYLVTITEDDDISIKANFGIDKLEIFVKTPYLNRYFSSGKEFMIKNIIKFLGQSFVGHLHGLYTSHKLSEEKYTDYSKRFIAQLVLACKFKYEQQYHEMYPNSVKSSRNL